MLQETYLGTVKLICIDPPYNTGNDFIYQDDFKKPVGKFFEETEQVDSQRKRLVANPESNGRFHSNWLSMMLPRLKLSKNILSSGGIILIHCYDVEVHNVRKICDEVFGAAGFVAQFVWKARQFTDARANTNVSTDRQYIVAYSKQKGTSLRGIERDESKFQNSDNDRRGPWMSRSILGLATEAQRPNLHYDIEEPETGRVFPPNPTTGWRYSKEKMRQLISEGKIIFPKKDDGRPREKKFRFEMTSELISFRFVIDDVFTADGTRDLREIFQEDVFPFPKPVNLIEILIEQVADEPSDIVLDFFAGSGTTAHATMSLNSRDGLNRRFILIQLPEEIDEEAPAGTLGFANICELSEERIRRTGKKILKGDCHPDWNRDVGFRVLKVDTSNMKDVYYRPDEMKQSDLLDMVDNVKEGRTAEDLLFQVLVD